MRLTLMNCWTSSIFVLFFASGCMSVPDRQTISPNRVPNMRHQVRSNSDSLNYINLRQDQPDAYRLGPKDTLGIYIENVTGTKETDIPIHQPLPGSGMLPATGYPFPVRDDGTLSLPLIMGAIEVEGLTLMEAEDRIRRQYTEIQRIIQPNSRIIVSLIRPRTYHVTVIREDVRAEDMRSNINQSKGVGYVGSEQRGVAKTLELVAYRNDVLNALNESGGMPGLGAKNEVIVLRGSYADAQGINSILSENSKNANNPNIIRIPLRARSGEAFPQLSQEDIILKDGDVVVIQSREAEVFYTGGLLQGGMYPIPRDFDLDVFGAMSMSGGSVAVAAGGTGNNRGSSVGSIVPPTRLLVIRKDQNGYQQAIKIDMQKAMLDPTQRILIQPNDLIVLEYTPTEVAMNMFLNTFSLRLDLQSLWD